MKKCILNLVMFMGLIILAALACISCTNLTKNIIPADSSDKTMKWLETYDVNAAAKAKKAKFLPIETLASLEKKGELLQDSHNELDYAWTERLNRMNDKYALASADITPKVKAANEMNDRLFGESGIITLGLSGLVCGGAASWLRGSGLKSKFATQLTTALDSKEAELTTKLWSDSEVKSWTESDATAVLVANGIDATKAAEIAKAIANKLTTTV